MPHILVVEDDAATRDLLEQYLADYKFRVTAAATAAEAEKRLAEEVVDLVVLDLNLPDGDGLALARKLRDTSSIPIVILTGRADEVDRVLGLELGADDYVTKPFSPRELLARMRAVLRRAQGAPAGRRVQELRAYRFAGWELRMGTRKLISPDGKSVQLSSGEFSLLAAFLKSPRQILTPRPAAGSHPAVRRCLRPQHRRADPAPAAQDRSRPVGAEAHQDRARRGLLLRRRRRDGVTQRRGRRCPRRGAERARNALVANGAIAPLAPGTPAPRTQAWQAIRGWLAKHYG